MKGSLHGRWLVSLALVSALAVPAPAQGGAARTRSGGGGTKASQGSATRASGRATYGYSGGHHAHGGGHHGGYHYGGGVHFGYYPYYGYGRYGYWGYYPHWNYGGWYGPRPYPVAVSRNAPATLETDIRPRKAEVRVDGQLYGQARDYNGSWDVLRLESGRHVVEFVAAGYMTLRKHIDVPPGGYVRFADRLQKGEGLDPRSTEAPPPEIATAQAGTDTEPAATPAPRGEGTLERGLLRIEASPSDAAVYLDGEFLARADELSRLHGSLPVATGGHTVEVVRPGYSSESVSVDVDGSEPAKVVIRLEKSR